ncbi:MAG: aldo/keto reductase [Pseudonocardia sp.]
MAIAWTLRLAPNVLLIPGTSSARHLEENLAVADIELDEDAQQQLTAVTG